MQVLGVLLLVNYERLGPLQNKSRVPRALGHSLIGIVTGKPEIVRSTFRPTLVRDRKRNLSTSAFMKSCRQATPGPRLPKSSMETHRNGELQFSSKEASHVSAETVLVHTSCDDCRIRDGSDPDRADQRIRGAHAAFATA